MCRLAVDGCKAISEVLKREVEAYGSEILSNRANFQSGMRSDFESVGNDFMET